MTRKFQTLASAGLALTLAMGIVAPASAAARVAAATYKAPKYTPTAKAWWKTNGKRDTYALAGDLFNLDKKLSTAAIAQDCQTMSKGEVRGMYDLQPPKTNNLSGIWYGFLLDVATTASYCIEATQSSGGKVLSEAKATYNDSLTYLTDKLIPALKSARLI